MPTYMIFFIVLACLLTICQLLYMEMLFVLSKYIYSLESQFNFGNDAFFALLSSGSYKNVQIPALVLIRISSLAKHGL